MSTTSMSVVHYFTSIGLFFGTIILVAVILTWGAVMKARGRLAHEGAYLKISEDAIRAQSETAAALAAIGAALADLKDRVGTIEKVLKDVE